MDKMIVFHGRCHGCTMQNIHGVDNCIKCCWFDMDHKLKDLNNRPPSEAEIVRKEVKARAKTKLLGRLLSNLKGKQ